MPLRIAILACCLVAAASSTSPSSGQEAELIARGRETYEVHCSNCHGLTGRGDGELAELLKVPPTDLRTLTRRHGGTFPFNELYLIIDGRREVRGHGTGEMPIWGLTFQERGLDANQEDMVRGRILQLIFFLRSIQEEAQAQTRPEENEERR